ncbi:hypothetical protein ASPACDRAFT_77188 [Aspergillus aculeatus ATCC 16872]|uniref:Uncharacterized protein n=1 Tax=Aspergillus aculeatus (strain ATCC 16872 / CBS 172.66 / WB 5094) TaxID=690307 RepID=A0A1L9WZ24_ASPA1|nr:uncharacterized protein ASPACDRAFT_77188 [Aspergillus aculeatus ATCC 16872]OJK01451.1 hypothetical protein ASPACDRAFT_77188 [Aspergillus aculeatus ATCC 16872]
MVLVDAVQERMQFETWPDPSIAAVTAGLDYMEALGLAQDHRLTAHEWAELMAEEGSAHHAHHARQAARELSYLQPSRAVLTCKRQLVAGRDLLRGRPLSVLCGHSRRDQQRLYDRGVSRGVGLRGPARHLSRLSRAVGRERGGLPARTVESVVPPPGSRPPSTVAIVSCSRSRSQWRGRSAGFWAKFHRGPSDILVGYVYMVVCDESVAPLDQKVVKTLI